MHSMVEQLLRLRERAPKVRTQHDQTVIERQIDAVDRQIDQLVYELYGLTDKEIAVVEGSAVPSLLEGRRES